MKIVSIFIFSIALFAALLVFSANAEDGSTENPYTRPVSNTIKEGIRQIQQNVNQQTPGTKPKIQEIKRVQSSETAIETSNIKNRSNATTPEETERRKRELREAAENKREELKSRIEEIRGKAKEEMETKRAELKERLQNVRDEQKKKIVERLEKQLNELNERLVNHFSNVLDRLEKVLANIESRTEKAEARGWDVSAVRTMIQSAGTAINEAKLAVEAQSGKNYIPEISGEEGKLRVEVGEARQVLHNDLAAVREKIRLAYETVRRVAATLAQVSRIDEEPSPAPTPVE